MYNDQDTPFSGTPEGRARAAALASAPSNTRAPEPKIDCKTRKPRNTSSRPQATVEEPSQVNGRITGSLGMLYMGCYALYTYSVLHGTHATNLGEVIGKAAAINQFTPFLYCLIASAALSLVGVIGKQKICILLALAATFAAFCVLPGALARLIIPAALFVISFWRMNNSD